MRLQVRARVGPVTYQKAVVAVGEANQQYAANRAGHDSRPSHEDGGAHAMVTTKVSRSLVPERTEARGAVDRRACSNTLICR